MFDRYYEISSYINKILDLDAQYLSDKEKKYFSERHEDFIEVVYLDREGLLNDDLLEFCLKDNSGDDRLVVCHILRKYVSLLDGLIGFDRPNWKNKDIVSAVANMDIKLYQDCSLCERIINNFAKEKDIDLEQLPFAIKESAPWHLYNSFSEYSLEAAYRGIPGKSGKDGVWEALARYFEL